MKLEICHGRKPKVRKLKKAKLWVVTCSCGCGVYRAGATNKRYIGLMWNDLVNNGRVEG